MEIYRGRENVCCLFSLFSVKYPLQITALKSTIQRASHIIIRTQRGPDRGLRDISHLKTLTMAFGMLTPSVVWLAGICLFLGTFQEGYPPERGYSSTNHRPVFASGCLLARLAHTGAACSVVQEWPLLPAIGLGARFYVKKAEQSTTFAPAGRPVRPQAILEKSAHNQKKYQGLQVLNTLWGGWGRRKCVWSGHLCRQRRVYVPIPNVIVSPLKGHRANMALCSFSPFRYDKKCMTWLKTMAFLRRGTAQ